MINLNNYVYHTPDKMYNIQLDKLDFRATTGKLRINSFALVPLHDEMNFGKVAGFAKERFNIKMSDIMLNGIDLPLYISKQELWAKEMAITNGFVSVFNHNGLPKNTRKVKSENFPISFCSLLMRLFWSRKSN